MSIRKVVRPETETHFIEFPFHWCKDENEYLNATKDIPEEDIIHVMRSIDSATFYPIIYFAIRRSDQTFSQWLKYGVSLEHIPIREEAKTD